MLGGFALLHQRMRRSGLFVNLSLSVLVIGGFSVFIGGANPLAWVVLAVCFSGSGALAAFLHTNSQRIFLNQLVAILDGKTAPTAVAMDIARREILMLPWLSAGINIFIWSLTTPVAAAALSLAHTVSNHRLNPALIGLALIPAATCINLFAAHLACEPYRTALFTGVDMRSSGSLFLLHSRKRFGICLAFSAYLTAYCVALVLISVQVSENGRLLLQRLPELLAVFSIVAGLFLAAMSWLALRSEPLEQQSFTDPDAIQALQAAYVVAGQIGKGGMGIIYQARHRLLDRTVAIKMLDSSMIGNRDAVLRFRREAKASSRLQHPNIVAVMDFGVLPGGHCFIVMEYVNGATLGDVLNQEGALAEKRAVPLFIAICEALAYAHEQSVLHRDLKPSNIMVTSDGVIKILDFGIAKIMDTGIDEGLTHTGQIFGTPAYMSPEQCAGANLDQRSDIYSMGCLMFETLTGSQPYSGASMLETISMHMTGELPTVPEHCAVSAELQAVLRRTMQKAPDDRFGSMRQLSAVLRKVSASSSAHTDALSETAGSLAES